MDTVRALIDHLHTRLTGDAALAAIFPDGTVHLFPDWAEQDADVLRPGTYTPYLVHEIDLDSGQDESWALMIGTYTLNIWDRAANQDRALAIRARLRALLVNYGFRTDGGELVAARLGAPSDQAIPDTDPDVWRRELVFPLRFFDVAEVSAVNART